MPLALKTKLIVGALSKRDYVIAQINHKRRNELREFSKRAGIPADMLMREEMLRFINKRIGQYVGGKKVEFVGEKDGRVNLSIRCPADLAISFKTATKGWNMNHSIVLRACVDKILSDPKAV